MKAKAREVLPGLVFGALAVMQVLDVDLQGTGALW